MIHPDLYSKEAELANDSKRSLTDGNYKDALTKMKLLCLSRGATGVLSLARAFRLTMGDGQGKFGMEDFRKALKHIGFHLDEEEIRELCDTFDEKGDGSIDLSEFIIKLRPELSQTRLNIIDKAFTKMDKDCDGAITVDDLRRVYSVKDHPKYRSGERSEDEILDEFLKVFEKDATADGKLTKEEFVNYYAGISAAIEDDGFFDLVLRKAYKI